ncbi:MAG: hypothetical protein NXI04_24295 [Planctomycetaceae bacterium]|nr:hypothetical protein [Planctomycetaceae bacterium]
MHSGTIPRCLCALLVSGLLLFAAPATADERPSRSAEQILNTRGSLTLRDVTLSQALFTISESWHVNLLFGNSIEGSVNGVFRDATLREVLDSVLLANGYGYRPKGQSLIIMSLEDLGDSNAMLETESIPWSGPVTEDVIKAAELMLSPQGKLQPVAALRAVMVRDYPENVTRIRQLLQSAAGATGPAGTSPPATSPALPPDTVRILNPEPVLPSAAERTVIYLTPRHTTATTLQEPMQSFLSASTKVVPIETENRLVIVGPADELALAQRIFHELDQPRGQVRITALIYDVNTEELERLGVNWTHNVKAGISSAGVARQTFGGKFGPFPDPSAPAFTIGDAVDAATTSTIGAARFTTLNRYLDVDAIVSALDSTDGARLLADPSVTVLDREEASIKIVTEVPIQQLTQTSEGGSIGTTSFREAGVTLTVTPQIGGDGTITMAVTPTFSVLTGFSEGQPIIDSREASTRVRIADRQTLVIGGLRQRSENENVSGIPGVMKWKHFGKLFRSHATTVQESELIVFLRPEITTPTSLGTQREASALCVTQQKLNATNWPTTLPITPDCRDPYCPYHNPRPRFINPQQAGSAWSPPAPATPPTTAEDVQWPELQNPDPDGASYEDGGQLSDPFREAPADNTFAPPLNDSTLYDSQTRTGRPYDERPNAGPLPPTRTPQSSVKYPREFERESPSHGRPAAAPGGESTRVEETFGFIQPVSHEQIEQLQSPPPQPRAKSRFSWKWPGWYRPISERVSRSK